MLLTSPLIKIKRIRAKTFLGHTSETRICENSTPKVSVKCIQCFAICASLKKFEVDRFDKLKVAPYKKIWRCS